MRRGNINRGKASRRGRRRGGGGGGMGVVNMQNLPLVARRVPVSAEIPEYVANPVVMRKVRISYSLNPTNPTATISPSVCSSEDASYYTNTSTARYTTVRVLGITVWGQGTVDASGAIQSDSIGIKCTELIGGGAFSDLGTSGSTRPVVRMIASMQLAMNSYAVSSTTGVYSITSFATIREGNSMNVIADVLCEFR